MRYLLVLLLLSGCSVFQHQKVVFMQHKDIVAAILAPDQQMDMQLDGEALDRQKMTIDIDIFFDDEMKALKNKKSFKDSFPIADVDLRYRDTPIKKQWNGTCTAFAGVAAL